MILYSKVRARVFLYDTRDSVISSSATIKQSSKTAIYTNENIIYEVASGFEARNSREVNEKFKNETHARGNDGQRFVEHRYYGEKNQNDIRAE